jgi:hypothetical protein
VSLHHDYCFAALLLVELAEANKKAPLESGAFFQVSHSAAREASRLSCSFF